MKKMIFMGIVLTLFTSLASAGPTFRWRPSPGSGDDYDMPSELLPGKVLIGGASGSPTYTITPTVEGALGGYAGPGFCVEDEIGIVRGKEYYATLDNAAYSGGSGALPLPGGDRLGAMTEYIYVNWRNGTEPWSDEHVRDAIYWAEDEKSTKKGANTDAETAGFYQYDFASDEVMCLNLWELDEIDGDIYYLIDRQSLVVGKVPAPGAVLLTGLGTCLVGLLRRSWAA